MIKSDTKFYIGQSVVYPSHGVGTITAEEKNKFAGVFLSVYVISFKKKQLELKIPKHQAINNGLRALTNRDDFARAINVLSGKKITSDSSMWSKRVKIYMNKLNSGNIVSIAAVLKELYPNLNNPDRSFSEKIIFDNALELISTEYALISNIDDKDARQYISDKLTLA